MVRKRFRQLCPISPLSTGSTPHFLLLRLGRHVHGEQVIGTAVPASPGAGNGKRKRQVTKGPISAGRNGKGFGSSRASREEAPDVSIILKRDAAPDGLRIGGERSGTRRGGRPKKGRGTLSGFGFEELRFQKPGRDGRKTSEPSGRAVK